MRSAGVFAGTRAGRAVGAVVCGEAVARAAPRALPCCEKVLVPCGAATFGWRALGRPLPGTPRLPAWQQRLAPAPRNTAQGPGRATAVAACCDGARAAHALRARVGRQPFRPVHSQQTTPAEAAAAKARAAPAKGAADSAEREEEAVQHSMLLADPATGSLLERQLHALVRARYGDDAQVPGNVRIIQNLVHYLWPQGEPALRLRVLGALVCLVSAKLLNIQVPFFFKHVVDSLAAGLASPAAAASLEGAAMLAQIPLAGICAYGVARIGASALTEARSAIFARVAQNAIRRISLRVFEHVHELVSRVRARVCARVPAGESVRVFARAYRLVSPCVTFACAPGQSD